MSIYHQEHFEYLTSKLIVAFSTQRLNWHGVLRNLGISHVLLMDNSPVCYNNGIPGLPSIGAIAKYVLNLTKKYEVTTLGLSGAGYAALLFGYLAEVSDIVTIQAITTYDPDRIPDRWRDRFGPPPDPLILDLLDIYRHGPCCPVRSFISDDFGSDLDRHMVERIGVTDITQIPGNYGHTQLAKAMRDQGMFEDILKG